MILYAESSAVLAWLLTEDRGSRVFSALTGASRVFASRLTLFECERTIRRAEAMDRMSASEAAGTRSLLAKSAARWEIVEVSAPVFRLANRRFPGEPVRSLDALHLGTALFIVQGIPDLRVLTLDDRVADNARLLGFPVEPAPSR